MGSVGRPEYLRQASEMSLRRLGVERIDLYQLHRSTRRCRSRSQSASSALQAEGKIRHIGLSEVDRRPAQGGRARSPIVSRAEPLQPRRPRRPRTCSTSATSRGHRVHPVVPARGRPAVGTPAARSPSSPSARRDARPRSRWPGCCAARRSMLPIPGTSSVAHLEENVAAAGIELTDAEFAALG